MGSKISIIEGNSNEKDNVRTYMVKGEKGDTGFAPSVKIDETHVNDGYVELTVNNEEGSDTTNINSPVITSSKENGTATITIKNGGTTQNVSLSDGEMTKAMVIDNLTSTLADQPLSAKQGKILNEKIEAFELIELTGENQGSSSATITLPTGVNSTNSIILGAYIGPYHAMVSENTEGSDRVYRWVNQAYFMSNNTEITCDIQKTGSSFGYNTVYVELLKIK